MFGYRFGDDDDGPSGSGLRTSADQAAVDATYGSSPSDWASYPGTQTAGSGGDGSAFSPPPMVSSTGSTGGSTDWLGIVGGVGKGLVDIFGHAVNPQPIPKPPPAPGMPIWGWVAIGVGGVVVLGVLARSMRRAPATAGYRRRRKHRRSRR